MIQSTKEYIKKIINNEAIFIAIILSGISIPLLILINRFTHLTSMDYYYWDKIICTLGNTGLILGIIHFIINIKDFRIKDKNNIPYILLILFLLWSFITCFFAENTSLAFKGTSYRHDGYIMYLAYAGFLISSIIINNKKHIAYKFLIIVATIISITNLFTIYFNKTLFISGYTNSAIFYNPNHFGYYLVIPLIFSINYFITEEKWYLKILYLVAYILLFTMLIQTNTVGSYLACLSVLILIVIYYFFIKHTWLHTSIIVILFIIISLNSNIGKSDQNIFKQLTNTYSQANSIVTENKDTIISMIVPSKPKEGNDTDNNLVKEEDINPEDRKFLNYGSGRLRIWINSINRIIEKPILGYGIENITKQQISGGYGRPHNLILQLCLFVGIPGAILYLTALAILILKKLRILTKLEPEIFISLSACIGYLISAMFGNSMFYTSPYFFITLGGLFF